MTSTTAPKLKINRLLNGSAEKIFSAWTDPARLVQWFGPSERMTCEVPELELRVGGRYTILMHSPDGERHCVSGEYREIIPNEKLVFSWAWESTPDRVSQVTVTLRPHGDQTRLQLTHEQFFDESIRDRHNEGWSGSLDRLAAKIETLLPRSASGASATVSV
ncbi:MAG: SRPBCC family protein [Hyphomicrobiaceae bacterium]